MLNVINLSVIMVNVIKMIVEILNVIKLSVDTLNVIKVSVVMLSVMSPAVIIAFSSTAVNYTHKMLIKLVPCFPLSFHKSKHQR
jgi:hypothetical protein